MQRRVRYPLAAGFGLALTLCFAAPTLLAGSGLVSLGPSASDANAAQDPAAQNSAAQDPAAGGEHQETELEAEMNAVKARLRALRRSLRDPEAREASLASLQELQASLLACKDQVPLRTAHEPEAERAAFVTAYRKEMVRTLVQALEVETLLLDGDDEAAQEAFDALRRMEDPAHERFTEGD